MNKCIFCDIVNKKASCDKIYDSEKVLAFLDINPATLGHILVIPKKHYENVFDIDEEVLAEIMKTGKKIAGLMKEKLGALGVNFLNSNGKIAQQEIMHYHLHIIPRYKDSSFKIEFKNTFEGRNFKEIQNIMEIKK